MASLRWALAALLLTGVAARADEPAKAECAKAKAACCEATAKAACTEAAKVTTASRTEAEAACCAASKVKAAACSGASKAECDAKAKVTTASLTEAAQCEAASKAGTDACTACCKEAKPGTCCAAVAAGGEPGANPGATKIIIVTGASAGDQVKIVEVSGPGRILLTIAPGGSDGCQGGCVAQTKTAQAGSSCCDAAPARTAARPAESAAVTK